MKEDGEIRIQLLGGTPQELSVFLEGKALHVRFASSEAPFVVPFAKLRLEGGLERELRRMGINDHAILLIVAAAKILFERRSYRLIDDYLNHFKIFTQQRG